MYAGNLYVNKSRQNMEINFSNFRAKLWNCLKPDWCKHKKKPFKNVIHQLLFAVLGDEDGYCMLMS